MKHEIYKNAPLIEIILEIRWRLKNISVADNLQIDPYFDDFKSEFEKNINHSDFSYKEVLVPDNVPREFLGGKVTHRYRRDNKKYPLYQIGYGVFTINMAPPYNGWEEFKRDIENGLNYFYASYPVPEKFLKCESLELRYMNFFGKKHLYGDNFLSEHLGIEFGFKRSDILAFDEKVGELTIPHREDSKLLTHISFNPASNENSEKGLLLTIASRKKYEGNFVKQESIIQDIENSHGILSNVFDKMISSRLKEVMRA